MAVAKKKQVSLPSGNLNYPHALKEGAADNHYGTTVPDPYRGLESRDASATSTWVEAQGQLSRTYLDQLPARPDIANRFLTMWNCEWRSAPYKQGNRLFYWYNKGLQNHDVLFVAELTGGEPRLLIDPNALSHDGATAVAGLSVSWDGNLMAYGVSVHGSDWSEWRVRDVTSGQDLADRLSWIKFSAVAWAVDGSGFYYSRYDEPSDVSAASVFHKLYFHKLGTAQSEDTLVYHEPDESRKDWRFNGYTTEDGHYLIIVVYSTVGGKNRIYYQDLATGEIVKLLDGGNARWSFVANQGPIFWFGTDLKAPRNRLVAIDVSKSSPNNLHMKEVIGEVKDPRVSLRGVHAVGKRFFAMYQQDACTRIEQFDLAGRHLGQVQLPGRLGAAGGFDGKLDEMVTYYSFQSYTVPSTIFRYDIATGQSDVYFQSGVPVDPSRYVTKLVFVESKDGTKVALFLSYRKGLKRNGNNPAILRGYGGFGDSIEPSFASGNIIWMDMGGIVAEACLRGGGEYGGEWHDAGTKLRKQNTFDDFLACAQWLINHGYTRTPKLAIEGTSNGGLLVCACLTQRPDLFGAVVANVPVTDMLRFHLFTAGSGWVYDYGCVTDGEAQFRALLAYSPYHNLRPGTVYPATLILTGQGDDRVMPSHSFKFGARLQDAQAGDAPCLIRIEEKTGHGLGTPLAKLADQVADVQAFLVHVLRIPNGKVAKALKANADPR
jgi:prolyl oligopeptidase